MDPLGPLMAVGRDESHRDWSEMLPILDALQSQLVSDVDELWYDN
jgi:hypothetical protein